MQFLMQINKLWKKIFLLITFFAYLILYSNTMASEAPYKIVDKNDIYEVRHYSNRLVVQVSKIGDNRSFRQLFNYILKMWSHPFVPQIHR